MKYDLLPEFKKYALIRPPMKYPVLLKAANALMPFIQSGRDLYPEELAHKKVRFSKCTADLYLPDGSKPESVMLYCHGGGFVMRAAAYHKNQAQQYAKKANCAVLFPDYRLAPDYTFPAQVADCFNAYQWLLKQFSPRKIIVGGDSAGGALAAAVLILAKKKNLRLPDGLMLVYPVLDSRIETESMRKYTDTPMWNSRLNWEMWQYYVGKEKRHHPLASPMEARCLDYFPPTYIETAQFDCLHDEGIAFAKRLKREGVKVELNETQHTMHGYDIAEHSDYVKKQVARRIQFLKSL